MVKNSATRQVFAKSVLKERLMYCSFCNSKMPEGETTCPICGYVSEPVKETVTKEVAADFSNDSVLRPTPAPAVQEPVAEQAYEAPTAPIGYKVEQDPLDKGIIALVFGVISVFFGIIAGLAYNIAGLVFSNVAIKKAKQALELYPSSNGGKIAIAGMSVAKVGRVLSIIAIIINALSLLLVYGILFLYIVLIFGAMLLSIPMF